MARKLNHSGYGKRSCNIGIHVGKVYKDSKHGHENYVKDWEESIKKLMKEFNFNEKQIGKVLEKAKTTFVSTDKELDKYNKAWNFFKQELCTI